MVDVQKAWDNLIKHEGEVFKTVRGLEFTYTMSNNNSSFKPSRTDYVLSKSNFEKAYNLMPADTTRQLAINGVRGQSYVLALLNDSRIVGY